MADEFRRHDRHPEDLTRQFKDLGTTDPAGNKVYAEVVALEPASIGGGGGGAASVVAIADGAIGTQKASVSASGALKVDNSANTQPISAASLPLPTGAATETTLAAVNTKLAGTIAVSGTFWQATQPISAASLPLPTGAATSAAQTDRTQKTQITDGTRDGTVKAASTLPAATDTALVVTLRDSAAVTGTFWQATQPISAASLPLPTGAATETTLAAISGKLPATLGQKAMSASLAVVLASDQSAIPVSQSGTWTVQQGTPPWQENLTQVGGTAVAATAKGTQGTNFINVQEAKDSGRVNIMWTLDFAPGATAETLATVTESRDGATTTTFTTKVVTSGKRLRITSVDLFVENTLGTSLQRAILRMRFNTAGAVTTGSALQGIWEAQAAGTVKSVGSSFDDFPDGIEFLGDGTKQIGFTVAAPDWVSATSTLQVRATIFGYEY